MRKPCIFTLLASFACSGRDGPPDELDPDVIDELSTDQGSATGTTWTGNYSSTFASDSCDCPTVTIQDTPFDLCSYVEQGTTQFTITQADGFMSVVVVQASLTGAIEADGSFVVAGRKDLSTLVGPVDLLSRMDGTLEMVAGQAQLSATAGQRLIGEFAGDPIDCRALGSVEAIRID